MSIKSVISDCMTVASGDAVDLTRVMALVGFITFIGLAIYSIVLQHQPFHYADFGIGLGGVVTAAGAAIKLNPENKV